MTFKGIGKLFQIPTDEPDFTLAQFLVSAKQIPLLYLLLTVNIWILAIPFLGQAPNYLSFYIPVGLSIFSLFRAVMWWRSAWKCPSVEMALYYLQRTNRLAPLMAVAFAGWCLSLFPYGDAYGRGHIAFFMGVTVLGCIACLMHIRSAAVMVTAIMTIAFVVFFGAAGNSFFIAQAVNMATLAVALLFILAINYKNFQTLIGSRQKLLERKKELIKKQFETQQLSDENFRLANVDDLTGLPNRRYFFSELELCRAAAEWDGDGGAFAVGLLDLNGFKGVNDVFGHAIGDYLLQVVAQRLRAACGDHVFVARLGGDEFALLIKRERSVNDLMACGLELRQALAPTVNCYEAEIAVSAALGFAQFEADIGQAGLYERADYALYQAKHQDGEGVVVFGPQHEYEIQRTRLIERAFHLPEFEREITLAFQPIVDSETLEILTFEALARWNSCVLGQVSPSEFIPVAEKSGFIDTLTLILLRKALAVAMTWPGHVGLSFNLSAKNIAASHVVAKINDVICASGIDPSRIDFEITETAMLSDFEQARRSLDALKSFGVNIALDDFGTGFSSLSHLHQLPLDKIKVDRSFVTNIGGNSASFDIVKSLVSLARDMRVGCIVEGVETDAEMGIVRALGAKMVQGYFVSQPLSAADADDFIRTYCCKGRECISNACFV